MQNGRSFVNIEERVRIDLFSVEAGRLEAMAGLLGFVWLSKAPF